MKYLLSAVCEDGTLLYNVVTGELLLLDEAEVRVLEALPAPPTEEMTRLIEGHFLIPEDFSEKKSVEQLRNLMRTMSRKKEITGYTILPTSCCNARCFYCYEADYPHITMTDEVIEDAIRFIENNHGEKSVSLSWFGGEPTLGEKTIDRICAAMQEKGIEYSSSMISNAYLFSPELARKAKELWKLTNIQITLDGTEEIYNSVKAYVGIRGSAYKKVLDNIGYILDEGIRVSVRMNLDRHNADNLKELIDELAERFSDREQFSAYVHALFDNCGFSPVSHSGDETVWLENKTDELNRYIEEKKLDYKHRRYELPSIRPNYCMADNDTSVIINPDGTLSKCEHYCCKEIVGNLKDGFTNQALLADWKQRVWFDECETCPIVPYCMNLKNCFSCSQCLEVVRNRDIELYTSSLCRAYEKKKNQELERVEGEKNEVD